MEFLNSINVIDILRLGISGLGFLLAYMAYRLLAGEQSRDRPRRIMLSAVYCFMAFSIVLSIIGFASEILGDDNSSIEQPPDSTPDVKATVAAIVSATLASQPTPTPAYTPRLTSIPTPHRAPSLVVDVIDAQGRPVQLRGEEYMAYRGGSYRITVKNNENKKYKWTCSGPPCELIRLNGLQATLTVPTTTVQMCVVTVCERDEYDNCRGRVKPLTFRAIAGEK